MNANNEIILYQSDNAVQLEVMLENETVWLTLNQMSILFERDKSVISRHISNIFKEQELDKNSVVAKNATTASDGKTYLIEYYNLDVIISVGYRVKSKRGTQFRIWANKVLKDYLLKGYAVNQRIENLERRVSATEDKIDFFVKTALPPVQGIFYDGQIFDAYKFVADLVKSATKSIVLIDNYLDESVLILLSKRKENVKCQIFTNKISAQFKLDLEKFNAQYPPVEVKEFSKSHDRFLIIDETIFQIGASLKDLGKKWFAFSKINLDLQDILKKIYQ
ncbi:MAG TPA: RhuM family protein [Paludibacteraceae bacterium]|nr:RhuM family protein [Paludibacteraceae bacterium]HPD59067.1 RhuM family protein [Paludibacteraceae bacterium]HPQ12874.1 RhuM family protein [Paludibacteraceae bacterium]HRS23872.1 RhuM family protein [Paludibacteraceae bacterium]HRT78311.1 RhuM family protein [Paludibacteraceae bacterium]